MIYLATTAILLLVSTAQQGSYSIAEMGGMLDFVEVNFLNMLEYGNYPAMYNSSYLRILDCGCHFAPEKITFGSQIGLQCHRGLIPGKRIPPMDTENCGSSCNDKHGFDIVVFCPPGWVSDCVRGCHPPDQFVSFEERVDFWEKTVDSFLVKGTDYIYIKDDYLEDCGCASKARQIQYGTGVGFDCVMKEDGAMQPSCNAASSCMNPQGQRLVTFCPVGHTSTCSGCKKGLESDVVEDKLLWMIGVTTELAGLSLAMLEWTPTLEQLLGCACKDNAEAIPYGHGVGLKCKIHGVEFIKESCGPNTICQDSEGADVLHICPRGYTPSCTSGCANPMLEMEEANAE